MPPQPEALPDMSPDPALQSEDRSSVLSQSVVSPPASYILPPVVPQLVTRQALATPPLLPHLRFESLHALRCCFDLSFPVQSEPQKLPFPSPPYSALGGIHRQPQMPLNPALYRRHHPLPRCLTAYVDIAVIRISAELVPASLQFSIQCVQVDVRQ